MPLVNCQELTWEPRFSFCVSTLFIENISERLALSIAAWKNRFELERMRQGHFVNDDEALKNGWKILKLSIVGSNISRSKTAHISSESICIASFVEAYLDETLVFSYFYSFILLLY